VERFENRSDMSGSRSLNNSTSKRVLNVLELVKLTVWEVMITVVKFRVNYGGGNGAGCFEVKVWADTRSIRKRIIQLNHEKKLIKTAQKLSLKKSWSDQEGGSRTIAR